MLKENPMEPKKYSKSHAPTLRSQCEACSARGDGRTETHREREEKRVRRRLTEAGPRGARGEEGGSEEAGGGSARH